VLSIQDRARWDQLLIIVVSLRSSGEKPRAERPAMGCGPYTLQAADPLLSCSSAHAGRTDWARIVALYVELAQPFPRPIWGSESCGGGGHGVRSGSGPRLVDALTRSHRWRTTTLLPSVRGEYPFKLGRPDEARAESRRCAALKRNNRERELLLGRARTMRINVTGTQD